MTLLFLLFFCIAICFALFRYVKTSMTFLIATILCFYVTANGMLPALLLKPLESSFVTPPPVIWEKSNAIVLLGAGTVKIPTTHVVQPSIMSFSRIITAARLYLACKSSVPNNACTVIISGGDALKTGMPEAVVYKDELVTLGVKDTDIVLEKKSMNTYKNAEFTTAILHNRQDQRVVLVTSGIHLQRALLYFANFGVHPIPVSSDYIAPHVSLMPTGYNMAITDFALHEYLGIARLYFYNFMGWNAQVSAPGKA